MPVTISNIFFDNRELNYFTTHNTALSDGNRWSMVGSSTVPHKYYGDGIKNRSAWDDNPSGDVVPALDRPWTFDDNYCVDIAGKPIPEGAKTGGYYADRTHFQPNEKFQEDWLLSLVTDSEGNYNDKYLYENSRWDLFEDRQATFVELQKTTKYEWIDGELIGTPIDTPSVNPGYGLINKYVITIHNAGTQTRYFSYLFSGNKYGVNWYVNGTHEGSKEIIQYPSDPNINGVVSRAEEVFRIPVSPGTTTFTITVELRNGSNPTAHNAFAIDVQGTPQEIHYTDNLFPDAPSIYNLYPNNLHSLDNAILYNPN